MLPDGFGIELRDDVRELRPGLWRGGSPIRVLRLNAAGSRALAQLLAGGLVHDRATATVARRFVDAGFACPVPPAGTATPDVTVVVPVHDRAGELNRCLSALATAFPVIVVDDASSDGPAVRSVARRHGAELVRLPRNSGPAVARNAGLARVRTEFVAFLDSDTESAGTWIASLAPQLADPLCAAVAPRVVPAEQPRTAAGSFSRTHGGLDLGADAAEAAAYGRVAYVPTAALLARTAAVREVGCFDPALRVGEDVDLVWRLTAAGHRVRYEPALQVRHHDPATWTGLLARRFRYGRSAAPLALRHPGSLAPMIVSPWYTFTVVAALARRPLLTAVGAAGTVAQTRRTFVGASVPTRLVAGQACHGLVQTWKGLGRYAVTFGLPALVASTVRGSAGARLAAASLLVGPPLLDARSQRGDLGYARFVVAAVADAIVYGAGVLAGCLSARTTIPLRPVRVHSHIDNPTRPPEGPPCQTCR